MWSQKLHLSVDAIQQKPMYEPVRNSDLGLVLWSEGFTERKVVRILSCFGWYLDHTYQTSNVKEAVSVPLDTSLSFAPLQLMIRAAVCKFCGGGMHGGVQ